MKYLFGILVSLFIWSISMAATAVFGCGYTSDGVYRCSDLRPSMTRRYSPSPEEFVIRKINSRIISAKLVGYSTSYVDNYLRGYFDVELEFCGPSSLRPTDSQVTWKKLAEGNYRLNQTEYGQSYTWIMGGVGATIKDIPFELTYTRMLRKGESSYESCTPNIKTVHLFCDLYTSYDGADCNFFVNGNQTINLEILRNHVASPSVLLY